MKSNSRVYVIGHKNPDTDSICSAIAYADIKNRTDKTKTYMARRAGQINEETEYVLKRFGVRAPGYLPNAHRVRMERSDNNLSLDKITMFISDNNRTIQRIRDTAVSRPCQ